jgi:tol-pal system protein YbgF
MNGLWPMWSRGTRERLAKTASAGRAGQTARACAAGLLLACAAGCAHKAAAGPQPPLPLAPSAEEARLERQLAERDRTIQQLEGRMAMLEASERQLREQLASARVEEAPARETVRIGARTRESREPVREARPVQPTSEPRPMLRLQGDRMSERSTERAGERELTASWTAPTTSERLTVATVPRLSTIAAGPSAAPVAGSPGAAPASEPASAAGPADELYVHALDLLRRREFPEALRELDSFLRGFPGDARASRAHFWRGEILFAAHDFGRALAAFEQALAREPRGDKAPDTLLRIARCQQRLGAHERARAVLLQLRTQFPDSEAARVARELTQEDT